LLGSIYRKLVAITIALRPWCNEQEITSIFAYPFWKQFTASNKLECRETILKPFPISPKTF
jgi:hypothetical protein